MAKKYLIVGANVDLYRGYIPIPGAKKSGEDWKSFLDSHEIGFEQVAFLTDEYASRENILCALTNLFANLDENDYAVFVYVGHGKRIKDEQNEDSLLTGEDEGDGRDEELICNGTPITDDEIRILLNLNKKKAPVFILIDACYNGVVEKKFQISTDFSKNNEIVFSSAGQEQKAYMEDHNQVKQAVYSTFLLEILKGNLNKNYNEIFDLARDELKKQGYPQNPQLAFTNYNALGSPIFTTPISSTISIASTSINPTLKFTPEELMVIKNDPYKQQTELASMAEEMLAISILSSTLKDELIKYKPYKELTKWKEEILVYMEQSKLNRIKINKP